MYVELCYNISISKYKKRVILKLQRYQTYLLIYFVFQLKKMMTLFQMKGKPTSFLKRLLFRNAQMV